MSKKHDVKKTKDQVKEYIDFVQSSPCKDTIKNSNIT